MPVAPWTCSVFRGVDVSARKSMKDASKKQPSFSSVAIMGPGLLGGALALAVKVRMPHVHVRLWGRRPEPLEYALSIGAAHAVSTRVAEAVQGADLVVLATPVGVMPDIAAAMLPALKPGAVVTDVGSVKGCVHQSVGRALTRAGVAFIGSHPMAGSEKQGMEHASAELFQGATCILTNDEHVHEDVLLLLQRFWERAGCHCIRMQARSMIPPWPAFPIFRTLFPHYAFTVRWTEVMWSCWGWCPPAASATPPAFPWGNRPCGRRF